MDASESNFSAAGSANCPDMDWKRKVEFTSSKLSTSVSDGKIQVIIGSIVCIVGIVIYCGSLLAADLAIPETLFLQCGLLTIAAGFVLWLTGAIRFINAAIDSNSSDEIF